MQLALSQIAAGAVLVAFVLGFVALLAAGRWVDRKGTSRWITIPGLVIVLFVWFATYPKLVT
jgi:hypothetical protein